MKKHNAKLDKKKLVANNGDSSIDSENPYENESDEFEEEEADVDYS